MTQRQTHCKSVRVHSAYTLSDQYLFQYVNLLRCFAVLWLHFRGLCRVEGWRQTYAHTQSLTDYLSVLCLLCSLVHCRLFGSKQWNHSPFSLSLIRRRIWGEWELTCEQRRADCDYSAAGALNRCWLCLLLHSSRAAQLLGHCGAEEHTAATVNISLHFSFRVWSVINQNPSDCCECLGHLANITYWGFNCWSNQSNAVE